MHQGDSKPHVGGYRMIIGSMGYAVVMMGAVVMLPLLVLPFYPHEAKYWWCFVVPGVISIAAGLLMSRLIKGKKLTRLRLNRDTVMVVLAWISAIFIGAVPFMLSGFYGFTHAIFETTSGLSTTGFTVADVDSLPNIIIMYRSMLHLVGGVGLILIMSAVLSEVYGMKLYNAEGHMERLEPNLLHSARTILAIYAGYIVGGTVLYVIFGMPVFDALNYSISAVATGGFATSNEGITEFGSTPIYLVSIVLMILGGTNFLINLFLIKGKLGRVINHCETKLVIGLFAVFVPVFTFILLQGFTDSLPDAILHATFQLTTTYTTTGFCTTGFFVPQQASAMFPMVMLMVIGAAAGSTAGGIKEYRASIVIKSILWHIRSKSTDKRSIRTDKISKFGKKEQLTYIDKEESLVYLILHLFIVAVGSWIMTMCGYSFQDSLFDSASALGTIGLSSGITNGDTHKVVLWVEIVEMLIARLEIYVIILSAVRLFGDAAEGVKLAAKKAKRVFSKSED